MAKTASFNYENASHARNSSGIKTVMTDIDKDISNLTKALDGDKYKDFVNAVKKNWAGDDANRFLAAVEKDVKEVKKKVSSYSTTIKTRLEDDNRGFQKFQGTINF